MVSKRGKTRKTKDSGQIAQPANRPARRGRGRPPFVVTDEMRTQVRAASAFGATDQEMADFLRVDPKTLRRRFAVELRRSPLETRLQVGNSLFRMAVGAPAQYDANGRVVRAEVVPQAVAAIFWLKARAGWRDRVVVANDDDPSNPGQTKPFEFTIRDGKL